MTPIEQIKQHQSKQGMTRPAFAALTGYSLREIDHWRAGTRTPIKLVFRFLRLVELIQERHPETWREFMQSENK